MPEETTQEDKTTEDSAENAFRNNIFFVALDRILSALSATIQTTATICESFAPILKFTAMTETEIKTTCQALANIYHTDLSKEFENEVLHRTIYDAVVNIGGISLTLRGSDVRVWGSRGGGRFKSCRCVANKQVVPHP